MAQIVIQPLGKQRALTAVIANDKTRHRILRPNRRRIISSRTVFTQAGPKADIEAAVTDVRLGVKQTQSGRWTMSPDDASFSTAAGVPCGHKGNLDRPFLHWAFIFGVV